MRNHILPIHRATVNVSFSNMEVSVNALAPIELFGSKIKALLERTAARDLYDIHNMIYYNLFDESEFDLLRKCVIFYWSVGTAGDFTQNLPILNVDRLSFTKIRQTLLSIIRKGEKIDLNRMKSKVNTFVSKLLTLTDEEKSFMHGFSKGCYCPELLFDDVEIIERIRNHPMALWKCSKIQRQEI